MAGRRSSSCSGNPPSISPWRSPPIPLALCLGSAGQTEPCTRPATRLPTGTPSSHLLNAAAWHYGKMMSIVCQLSLWFCLCMLHKGQQRRFAADVSDSPGATDAVSNRKRFVLIMADMRTAMARDLNWKLTARENDRQTDGQTERDKHFDAFKVSLE
ncbi:hypothetical protein PoB_002381200 [Plakobranchus ocellatus]|uniref:Uncharacterized protein n=1 Tax=Plakobranchus ocellatus TaxID=259542 RepID=A0AAV3ZQ38_9GAST|nr:hypothetical protein PoB_002381200 [Plakobranchus ocellatus]